MDTPKRDANCDRQAVDEIPGSAPIVTGEAITDDGPRDPDERSWWLADQGRVDRAEEAEGIYRAGITAGHADG